LPELLEDLTEFLALHPNTLWMDVLMVDMNGVVRGKRYPRSEMEKVFRKGIQLPVSSYFLDVTGRCLDAEGRGYSDGDQDANCYPQTGTLAPAPWPATSGAQVLLSMPTDRGLIVDPRVHA
jgi:glutamine synthetase